MTALHISILSLVVAIFSLWLSYRNRIERIQNKRHSDSLEANQMLLNCDNMLLHAENSFREFLGLAFTHALLKVSDFVQIIDRIASNRAYIKSLHNELSENKNDAKKVMEILQISIEIQANSESFTKSLQENLRILEKEIDTNKGLNDEVKIRKLRESISHIKQWKQF